MSCLVQVSAYKLTGKWIIFAIFAAQSGAERPRERALWPGGFTRKGVTNNFVGKGLCHRARRRVAFVASAVASLKIIIASLFIL